MVESYRDRFSEIKMKIESLMAETKLHEMIDTEKRKFKLSKTDLKKFDDDVKNYLTFWSQFVKIHLDKNLPDEDKFQYLFY